MAYDVARIRSSFPALEQGVAYFDGPGGTQVPREVARAVADTLTSGISNRGTVTAAERRADAVVADARSAVADLLGGTPPGVVFARSMTQMTYDLSRALAAQWRPGDEVVVTRLDHDANIRPWVSAAETAGATVRWVEFDKETAELTVDHVRAALSPRTRLVAVTAASNVLGTRPDIPAIAEAVHEVGGLLHVDGVHLTPHVPVDLAELGADFYACSPYKFLGPHHGLLAADPALLEEIHPAKLLPSSNAVPERFELGTLPYELLAGTTAAIDFIAAIASDASDRRARLLESMRAVESHEDRLFARLLDGLAATRGVVLHGSPRRRTPTALFSVDGRSPADVYRALAERGVNAPASHFYAIEAVRWMGLGDAGAVRAGLAPYTDDEDVDRLLAGVAEVAR
ncbi:MAG TPA: cysteine desulfurase-like protein [Nocardioidaceae bacterium]